MDTFNTKSGANSAATIFSLTLYQVKLVLQIAALDPPIPTGVPTHVASVTPAPNSLTIASQQILTQEQEQASTSRCQSKSHQPLPNGMCPATKPTKKSSQLTC